MDKLTSKIEYIVEKNSDKIVEFIKHMYHICPEEVEIMLEHVDQGKHHITNKRHYEDKVHKLKWANKHGSGEKWKFDDIIRLSKIDFKNAEFTEFDYAYMVNKLYSKFCREIADMSYYLKMAKSYLEDDDDDDDDVFQGDFFKTETKHKSPSLYLAYNAENRRHYNRQYDYDDYKTRNNDPRYEHESRRHYNHEPDIYDRRNYNYSPDGRSDDY